MKQLLVIGASGLVGRRVYERAKAAGLEVVGTSTHGSGTLASFDLLRDAPERLRDLLPLDTETAVVVAAGKTEIRWCREHPREAYAINVAEMQRLLAYVVGQGTQAVWFSSDAVFDGRRGNYTETDKPSPLNLYGQQKAEMETWLEDHLPQVLVYRLAKLADDRFEGRHLFSNLYQQYQSGQPIRCIEGLTFNPTAVDDIAACVLLGLKQHLHGRYNVANPQSYRREQIARLFVGDRPCMIESLPLAVWHFSEPKALDTTLDTAKFQKACGGYAFQSMDELLASFWQQIEAHGGGTPI